MHLQGSNEDVVRDHGSAREEAGHIGRCGGTGDGRRVGAGQLPQQQLHEAGTAVFRILSTQVLSSPTAPQTCSFIPTPSLSHR